jgi:presenilin 1
MAFSCTMLLGLIGGLLWQTALERWELPCDALTFCLVLYNFAVVGIVAIFYQKVRPALPCHAVSCAWAPT